MFKLEIYLSPNLLHGRKCTKSDAKSKYHGHFSQRIKKTEILTKVGLMENRSSQSCSGREDIQSYGIFLGEVDLCRSSRAVLNFIKQIVYIIFSLCSVSPTALASLPIYLNNSLCPSSIWQNLTKTKTSSVKSVSVLYIHTWLPFQNWLMDISDWNWIKTLIYLQLKLD